MPALHVDDLLGVLGAVLVFASFWMKRSIPLRTVALASNVVFIAYATVAWLLPILALHCALLPLNALRLWQLLRQKRQDTASGKTRQKPAFTQPARQPARIAAVAARSSEAL